MIQIFLGGADYQVRDIGDPHHLKVIIAWVPIVILEEVCMEQQVC